MKKSLWIIFVLSLSFPICAQEVGIAATYFNVLYLGIENPINVVVANYDCDSILVSATMQIRKTRSCEYIVIPNNLNNAYITVSGVKNGEEKFLRKYPFRVLSVPDPVADVEGRSGGDIRIGRLVAAYGIRASLDDFLYEAEFKVKSYTVIIDKGNEIVNTLEFTGKLITEELKSQFRQLQPGDVVRFENIVAIGPANALHKVPSISFTCR